MRVLAFFIIVSQFGAAFARPNNATAIHNLALKKRLDFLFKDSKLKKMKIGVEVYSLTHQESLYSLNSKTGLSPASAVKVLTAIVALKKLGPNFTFKTHVLTTGSISNGVLNGDLYLKGGGDPSMVSERMYMLASKLKRFGVKKIGGKIYVDDSYLDPSSLYKYRLKGKTDRAYGASVSALSFNHNSTTVYFRSGLNAGTPARHYVSPDTGYISVINKSTTTSAKSRYKLIASRFEKKAGDQVSISGSIPLGIREQRSHFNVTRPAIYAGHAFRHFVELVGIKVVNKDIVKKVAPKGSKLLYSFESQPLREIVVLMNKYSNNLIADTIVLTLGKELKGIGTLEAGLSVLEQEATRIGINTGSFQVVSGSGLTRQNKLSAAHFVKLLNEAYLDFDILPEFLSSLPIAGTDGTLESRMKSSSASGRLRGKTGTINGVSTLVGIVQSKGGDLLAFAVLMNDPKKKASRMRPWQNYFGTALADYNRKASMSSEK